MCVVQLPHCTYYKLIYRLNIPLIIDYQDGPALCPIWHLCSLGHCDDNVAKHAAEPQP